MKDTDLNDRQSFSPSDNYAGVSDDADLMQEENPASLFENDAPTTVVDHMYDQDKTTSRGAALLAGIIAVFGVCLLFAWLVGKHGHGFGHDQIQKAMAVATASTAESAPVAAANPTQIYVNTLHLGADANPASTVSNPCAAKPSASSVASVSDADKIHEEAIGVIHGQYGNNPERRDRLGADYAKVQEEVNQILH